MLKNYFTIAWRNISKTPFYSFVNIAGLGIGIAFTLLIAGYSWNELQVNRHLKNADRQYILQSNWKDPSLGIPLTTLGPLAKQLKEGYPDLVANFYRWDGISSNISKGEKVFREGIQIGDSTFLNMYGFTLKYGNPATAFDGPYSVVITLEKAMKYFGRANVTGESLTIENFSGAKHDFIITGVMNEPARNSVNRVNDDNNNQFYISANNLNFFGRNMSWANQYIVSYIELKAGVKPGDLKQPIAHLIKQNAAPTVAANLTQTLVPLREYYLSANNGLVRKMIYTLSAIAFFILGMAIINFVNLSVSRSGTRMKEIGIRKVLGGLRRQLIMQFLSESVILVFFATLLGLLLYVVTRKLCAEMIGRDIPAISQFPLYFILFPLALVFVVGCIAGIYPSFVLSALKSVDTLKGRAGSIEEKIWLRKSMVAFQFGIAAIVLIGAIVISEQIGLFFSGNLGYDKEYVVAAQVPRDWTPAGVNKMEVVRQELARLPQVKDVSLSYEIPDGNNSGAGSMYRAGADSTSGISVTPLFTDEHYAEVYHIPVSAGVFYGERGHVMDSSKVVINESCSRALGFRSTAEAVGQLVRFPGAPGSFSIAGVTRDFHFGSMRNPIEPVVFLQVALTTTYRFFSFKLKAGDMAGSLAGLQQKWTVLLPGAAFEYKFMDETLKNLYKTEIQLKRAAYSATALSLVIVLLGVLGLISLSIQKRTREIGIRKVLGSSVRGIILLFMKEFLGVVFVAGFVACPLAYLLMKNWLQDYAYHIQITAVPFLIAIISLGIVTAVLIMVQTVRTALANPVRSLRTE